MNTTLIFFVVAASSALEGRTIDHATVILPATEDGSFTTTSPIAVIQTQLVLAPQGRISFRPGSAGFPPARPARRPSYQPSRPLFAAKNGAAAQHHAATRRAPRPLVTSEDVARTVVRRTATQSRWGW